jgi:archaellum biogenesis protein FlaJ (TadC family)
MSILAAGGLSVVRIIDRISQVESSKEINVLFTKFLANIQLYDLSPNQSLRDIISRCPSTTFNRILTGIENTIKTSSDLSSYLNYEVRQLFALKEQKIKSMLNSLTFISEIYVTVLIVAPILFIVMLTTFTMIGSQSNLLIMYLNIITFLVIPVLSAVFFIILDALIEDEE